MGTVGKKIAKKVLLVPIIMSMLISCVPGFVLEAFASGEIAHMNGVPYYNFNSLADDLDDKGGETVTIEMERDWDFATDSKVNERLVVPKDCNLTINMHGHMFNRRLTQSDDYKTNGELFLIKSGAEVTINGGPNNHTPHEVYIHNSTSRDKYATKKYQAEGGTLSGGSSTNGAGCFHIQRFSSLTLNNVTVAGCRAEQSAGTDGYGGAIFLEAYHDARGECKIRLNDSKIVGCYAYNDGGAIYSDTVHNSITLRRSSIESNFSGRDGAGVHFNYARGDLSGDEKSEISYNQAARNGGGVYTDQTGLTISGLLITNNKAERGGGIYVNKDATTISSCIITNNSASFSGGGVYLSDNIDEQTVSGSTVIKDNGHDLYFSDSDPTDNRVLFNLTKGADVHIDYYDTEDKDSIMVTPGKVGDEIKNKNCIQYLSVDNPGYYVYFEPAANQRKVYIKKGTAPKPPEPTEVQAAGANDASHSKAINYRRAGKVGKVGPGGNEGNEYDLIRGFYLHEETDSGTDDHLGVFYYSDALFDDDQYKYNEHLATASWHLAFAGTYLRKFEEAETFVGAGSAGNRYYNKHAGARQFLADIGCPDQMIYVNDSMVRKPKTDSIGCTIGSKELAYADGTKTGKILIPVTVRGGGYESEWASNCTLGRGDTDEGKNGEAKGFSGAADQVEAEIDKYIKKYGYENKIHDGKVVFWVSGFSRAGATANITSKRLVEKYADGSGAAGKNNVVFGYTCEAAKGGTDNAQTLGSKSTAYHCIHNMINTADVVPLVAPKEMGFKRYGVDHYIPGTEAGEIKEDTYAVENGHGGDSGVYWVTSYSDNSPIQTKTDNYNALRDGNTSKYKKSIYAHLAAIDPKLIFDDYFHPMAMNFIPPHMYENGDYDENRVEDFLVDFFRAAQDGLPDSYTDWSIAIKSRDKWAHDPTKINGKEYSTVQTAMRNTMALMFSMGDDDKSTFMDKAASIAGSIDFIFGKVSLVDIYDDVIGDWHTLDGDEKEKYIKFFWDALKDTGALDVLTSEQVSNLEKDWPAMADFAFHLTDNDYNYEPGDYTNVSKWAKGMDESMTYIPTFATFANYILTNHYPEVNIAWTRMNDDWYMDEDGESASNKREDFKEYELTPPVSVNVPAAYVIDKSEQAGGGEGTQDIPGQKNLIPNERNVNFIASGQRIYLENKDIVGEAIYYEAKDITGGESEDAGEVMPIFDIYRGGIDLTLGKESKKIYKITTYDMSYGIKSINEIFYINLTDGKHDVIVNDKIDEGEEIGKDRERSFRYSETDEVRFSAGIPSDKRFTSWTVTDDQDRDVTETVFSGDYKQYRTNANAAFVMPIPDDKNKLSKFYSLTITAGYGDRISLITPTITKPETGEDLDSDAAIIFDTINGKIFTYPIVWTYRADGKDIVTSGPARADTTYTAWITMPQEQKCPEGSIEPEDIAFADTVQYDEPTDAMGGGLKRNPYDGSVRLGIIYKTDPSPTPPPKPTTVKLIIKAYDQNIQQCLPESEDRVYNVLPGTTITMSPQDVKDELFNQWNMESYDNDSEEWTDSGVRIVGGADEGKTSTDRTVSLIIPVIPDTTDELTIQAEFRPLVSNIAVKVPAPVGGQEMATEVDEMIFHITNDYIVEPECTQITWSPAPKKSETGKPVADFDVPYTATVTLKPYSEGEHAGKIKVTDKDDTSKVYYIPPDVFLYAENATAAMNEDKANLDTEANAVLYTFPSTRYELAADAESPDDIPGLPHGTTKDAMKGMLPKTIKVLRNDGMEVDAEVIWGDPANVDPEADPRSEAVWNAEGTVKLPDNMGNSEHYSLSVSMNFTVNEADSAASPNASLPSGKYMANQKTTLSTDTEGGTIWYTLDGSDPTDPDNLSRKEYEGGDIPIDFDPETGKTTVKLRAYTVKDGLWDSIVSTYIYEFTNEIPVPEGCSHTYNGKEQIGVEGGVYYTLVAEEGSGVTIDDEGNAVAVKPGTYTVTAKIKPGFVWIIANDDLDTDADESRTTTDDQTIRFTIAKANIADVVKVSAEGKFKSLDELKKALKVEPIGSLEPVEGEDYEIIYGEVKNGKVKVTVKGIGDYYTGAIECTFIINPDKKKYTITYDLNGGNLDGVSGIISEEFEEGEVIKLPKPSRKGYSFDYWEGSRYEAGDKYKVKEDHTFTAQWKEDGSGDKDGSGANTGDNNNMLPWVMILILAGIAAVSLPIVRRRRG